MEKLILGLLMLKKFTVYEIRAAIRLNFQAMCSDSLGSIQAAIKRLLEGGMITFSEYVEKSVNKKQYSITDKGRAALMEWLQTPANISGSKNMELGKLLFMGMLPAEERSALIDGMVAKLEQDLNELLAVQSAVPNNLKESWLEFWKTDLEYYGDVSKQLEAIAAFEEVTLQYGIDIAKFNIEWFRKLKETHANFITTKEGLLYEEIDG